MAESALSEAERGSMSTHGELVAAGLRDPDDMYGLIPDSYICVDCGMDTSTSPCWASTAAQLAPIFTPTARV